MAACERDKLVIDRDLEAQLNGADKRLNDLVGSARYEGVDYAAMAVRDCVDDARALAGLIATQEDLDAPITRVAQMAVAQMVDAEKQLDALWIAIGGKRSDDDSEHAHPRAVEVLIAS
jgi:hypothetical protein